MRSQSLIERRFDAFGDLVVVRGVWRGELAGAVGNLPADGEMTVHMAMFFTIG